MTIRNILFQKRSDRDGRNPLGVKEAILLITLFCAFGLKNMKKTGLIIFPANTPTPIQKVTHMACWHRWPLSFLLSLGYEMKEVYIKIAYAPREY